MTRKGQGWGPRKWITTLPPRTKFNPALKYTKVSTILFLPALTVYSKPDAGQIFLLWVWQVAPEVLSVKKVLRGSVGNVPHFCSFLGTLFSSRLYFLRLSLL